MPGVCKSTIKNSRVGKGTSEYQSCSFSFMLQSLSLENGQMQRTLPRNNINYDRLHSLHAFVSGFKN